jgi:tRNA(Ile)-lysidine synthetase-like protein
VLPALEEAVPNATKAIHRFSRLCMDDEDYLSREADKLISQRNGCGYLIAPTKERVLLKRAAVHLIARCFGEKDYTAEQLEQLNNLQNAENGKRFEFLGLTAIKEPKGIALLKTEWLNTETEGMPFTQFSEGKCNLYAAQPFVVTTEKSWKEDVEKANISSSYKILKIDLADIPSDAVVRFMQKGDTFCKFGGGTKKLGDYFTDCKIPLSLRGHIPLVAQGHNVLLVGGVEISENVKLNNKTQEKNIRFIICRDYRSM